jgi:N-acetylmuramoyl-L-alanine amidase-like protein
MRRLLTGLLAAALVAAAGAASPAGQASSPASAGVGASAAAVAKPPIHKMLIPYPAKRKREMKKYSLKHYGRAKWQLVSPKQIVLHYAEAGSIGSIYNTFAADTPDVEFHQLPGVCSHYAVGADGGVVKFVPPTIRCRHTVGLNHVSIGIEHVGFSDQDILGRPAQLNGSLAFTQWLRCRFGISVENVIGHNESLSSPFYKELDPRFKGQTHGDWNTADMNTYRSDLRKLGDC